MIARVVFKNGTVKEYRLKAMCSVLILTNQNMMELCGEGSSLHNLEGIEKIDFKREGK